MEFTKGELEIGNTTYHNIIIVGGKNREYICSVRIQQTGGGAIAAAMEPKRIANAKEIVRRWNAFEKDGLVDELREALKENYEFTKYAGAVKAANTDEYLIEFFAKGESAQKVAKAAIAKVS